MTTVEILFRYKGQPSEVETFALANAREVYGIRRLYFDRAASTLLVEYDATRLNAATVTQLVRRSGLQLVEELPEELPVALPEPEKVAALPVVDTKPETKLNPSPQTLPPPPSPGPVPPPVPGSAPASTPLP